MQHVISYDLARGLHIIAVIAWMSGLLMLPRFYECITVTQCGEAVELALLKAARQIRTLIMAPALVLAWAFGLFLFGAYFIPDREMPLQDMIATAPFWFWMKFALVVAISAQHVFLVEQGLSLAKGERRHSESFWRMMSVAPFFAAIAAVMLATLEPR